MPMLKRLLVACGGCVLLSACGSRIDSMQETIEYAVFGPPDINLTAQQIADYNYPLQYLRVGDGPQIVLGLAFDDKRRYKWLSGQSEILVTYNGRAIQTQGLATDLTDTGNLDADPLGCLLSAAAVSQCPRDWQTTVTVGEGLRASTVNLTTSFEYVDKAAVTLGNGDEVNTEHWVETVRVRADDAMQWRNHFWIEPKTRRVVKSEQTLHPQWPVMQLTEIKPYSGDIKKAALPTRENNE